MELFVINRYEPSEKKKGAVITHEDQKQLLLSKIQERKRKIHLKETEELESKIKIAPDDEAFLKKKRKKKKKKTVEIETHSQDELEPVKEYIVLGNDSFADRNKVKRVLPHWLKNPSVVSVDLKNLTHTIESIPYLDETLIEKLKQNQVTHFFPVQVQVIPWLLSEINRPSMYWPNDVCVSAPTGSGKTLAFVLPIIQALQKRLTTKIRALIVLPVQELAKQVCKVFKTYSAHTNLNVLLLSTTCNFPEEQKMLIRKDRFGGYQTLADIIVATPGRLVDHLQQTTGLSFKDLRYLVIDEADRVMEGIQNDWLYHINMHLGMHLGSTKSFQVSPLCLRTLQAEKRPPQKLLFSATLSQDPEKLQQLGLFQPKLFTSVVRSNVGGISDNNAESPADTGEFIGKFTTPAELTEEIVLCTAISKPLILLKLIETRNWKSILVFTKSCESTHRLSLLLKALVRGKLKVAEITAKTAPARRKRRLEQFSAGRLQIIVSSDALARGIDLPSVDCVISYDAPKYIKNHVHRVGRTGRAGKQGTAVTFLLSEQVNQFKQMMDVGRKNSIRELTFDEEELENSSELYQMSLSNVKKQIEIRRAISNQTLNIRRGGSRRKHKLEAKNKGI